MEVFEDGQEDEKEDKLLKVKMTYPKKSDAKNENSGRGRGRRSEGTNEAKNEENNQPARKSGRGKRQLQNETELDMAAIAKKPKTGVQGNGRGRGREQQSQSKSDGDGKKTGQNRGGKKQVRAPTKQESSEDKEKRIALLKVWYSRQKNIEYDELVERAQGLNGTEILDILNYKPSQTPKSTSGQALAKDGNDENVTDAGKPKQKACTVNLGLKASNKSPIKVIEDKSEGKSADESNSEDLSDEYRDGYHFSDSDEYERAKEISAITIMEDKTEEQKLAMIDEVDERFAIRKREKELKKNIEDGKLKNEGGDPKNNEGQKGTEGGNSQGNGVTGKADSKENNKGQKGVTDGGNEEQTAIEKSNETENNKGKKGVTIGGNGVNGDDKTDIENGQKDYKTENSGGDGNKVNSGVDQTENSGGNGNKVNSGVAQTGGANAGDTGDADGEGGKNSVTDGNRVGVNAGDNADAGGEGGKNSVTDGNRVGVNEGDGQRLVNENGQKSGNTISSNSHVPTIPTITTTASTGQSMYIFF